jgi:hypothetical protein
VPRNEEEKAQQIVLAIRMLHSSEDVCAFHYARVMIDEFGLSTDFHSKKGLHFACSTCSQAPFLPPCYLPILRVNHFLPVIVVTAARPATSYLVVDFPKLLPAFLVDSSGSKLESVRRKVDDVSHFFF